MVGDPPELELMKDIREHVRAPDGPDKPAPDLEDYVAKVRRHAYKVTDEDVAALLAAGHSQEEIYEITMLTALAAGIDRFEIGLKALRGAK